METGSIAGLEKLLVCFSAHWSHPTIALHLSSMSSIAKASVSSDQLHASINIQ